MIYLTEHAIERYHERVKPALAPEQARREAITLARRAEPTRDRPRWWYQRQGDDVLEAWAYVTEGIAFGLVKRDNGWVALTCCTAGGMSDVVREARRRRKRIAKARRRDQRWAGRKAPEQWAA